MRELSVVLLNWNRQRATLACLDRIAAWSELRPRIWMVDNASEDGSAAIVAERYPSVELIASPVNLGFGGGNNLALRRIEGDYVLLHNNDAVIAEDAVARLVAALDAHPDLAVVGPVFTRSDRPDEIVAAGGRDISRHIATYAPGDPARRRQPEQTGAALPDTPEVWPVDYVPGTVALLRVAALARVGLLDEDYFFGGELADLCARTSALGYGSAVLPAARAWHDAEEAAALRTTLYPYYILRNRFLFIRKFRRRAKPLLFALWSLYGVVAAAKAALAGQGRRARAIALGLADGLAGRVGDQNERVGL